MAARSLFVNGLNVLTCVAILCTGILLDANENSLGPPLGSDHAFVQEVLERYPCPYQRDLKQALADFRCAFDSSLDP